MSHSVAIVVLAAGKGTRLGGKTPKVLTESFCGPLLHEVLDAISRVSHDTITLEKLSLVVGFGKEFVEKSVRSWIEKNAPTLSDHLSFCEQKEQLGTGDAVKSAIPSLTDFVGDVLILCGDSPLVTTQTLSNLLSKHQEEKATLSVLTALLPEPSSYGRILRNKETGELLAIQEAKDASPLELLSQEVNSGVYVIDSAFLPGALQQLASDNTQGEYYLTDIVKRAVDEGQRVSTLLLSDSSETYGVNTYADLHRVNAVQQQRICNKLALTGVKFLQPSTAIIHPSATIGAGAVIGPCTVIGEGVVVGKEVVIEGMSTIAHSTICDHAIIKWGVRMNDSSIGKNAAVGPFAHLRPGTELGSAVKIGNFVEVKKSVLADGAKASHLSYLGDAVIGKDVNIGAGTITCNYDGYKKFTTTIEEGAFIGSNTALVAPVTIGKGATVGAGSAIGKDVSPDALALTRANQREVAGWSKKKRDSNAK